jgi:hypothetical protein
MNNRAVHIPLEKFDYRYYLEKNPDILKNLKTVTCFSVYNHWINHGIRENRTHRSNKDEICLSEKQKIKYHIAVLIHIFDVKLMHFFVAYLEKLFQKYDSSYFHCFINVVVQNNSSFNENNIYGEIKSIVNSVKKIIFTENKGGDIGGLLRLINTINDPEFICQNYGYVAFLHGKKNKKWRIELCKDIFGIKWEALEDPYSSKAPGILSSDKWKFTFRNKEYNKFKFHLLELSKIYSIEVAETMEWKFIAGTMFLANIQIIQFIHKKWEEVYDLLNFPNSIDVNWINIIDTCHVSLNRKNCTNDYQYRLKYGKSLLSDYMIEHSFERFIGLICLYLNKAII